jgi:hypothetical protein
VFAVTEGHEDRAYQQLPGPIALVHSVLCLIAVIISNLEHANNTPHTYYRSGGPGFDSRHCKKSSGSGTRSTQPREYTRGVNGVIFVAEK